MEGVGLVTGFQFLLGLAAVFAEEVGGFGSVIGLIFSGVCPQDAIRILRIHISTFRLIRNSATFFAICLSRSKCNGVQPRSSFAFTSAPVASMQFDLVPFEIRQQPEADKNS